ncbi:MAG: glycosyltransferase family 4 protein [Bacteroidales bacterium]|nr:glycosyltransferase family 4 protein [Bacteroidales bacterium]MCF8405616.1 glycosyltransferase family 4 protein [Bacteroidales bacterium]
MKIAIEGQRLYRQKKHGMDFVALELIRNLQKIDKENEYFVFVKPDKDKCLKDSENFHIIELEGKTYPIWEQWALPRAVRNYGCDLLHCTSNTAPVTQSFPQVVTVHDIIYLESISIFKKGGTLYQKMGNMYRRWNVPKVINLAKAVITVSEFEKTTMVKKFPGHAEKIHAIYNGVSEHFQPINDKDELLQMKRKYNLPDQFIFYLGNTDPKKNTPNVLKAYGEYVNQVASPLPLVMIDLGADFMARCLKENNTPDLMDHIQISGYIENTDLPAIYSAADLFLYPSLRESFGIPALEAMRCGAPVLTSNTSSMPEVSGNAAFYVDPFKPEEITAGIIKILNNKALRDEMILKGYQRAAVFSWTKMAREVLELYKNI